MTDKERIDILETEVSSLKEELSALRETQDINREVLDANVVSIYNRMAEKHNTIMLCFSSVISCVLLIAGQIMANRGYPWDELLICLIFLSISTAIMIITTIRLLFIATREFKQFIKNKEWQNFKRKDKKDV